MTKTPARISHKTLCTHSQTPYARRICRKSTLTQEQTMMIYHVAEVQRPTGSIAYAVVAGDTQPGIFDPQYTSRADAELHADIAGRLPEGYRISRGQHRQGSMARGSYWRLEAVADGKPLCTYTDGTPIAEGWTLPDLLAKIAAGHAAKAVTPIAAPAPVAAPMQTGWSNAAKRRAGRPASHDLAGDMMSNLLGTSPAAPGTCHYCGLSTRTHDCY
jgi:hypothetical protein